MSDLPRPRRRGLDRRARRPAFRAQGADVAVTVDRHAEVTRMLSGFQRDARAMLEQLLPLLRRPGLYPDAIVDGWGDARGGQSTATTVVLMAPKGVRPTDRTKQLGRIRLEADATGTWTATVSIVAQADQRFTWPPASEAQWWTAAGERFKTEVVRFRQTKG